MTLSAVKAVVTIRRLKSGEWVTRLRANDRHVLSRERTLKESRARLKWLLPVVREWDEAGASRWLNDECSVKVIR